ncbi:MAG TPA: IS21 family transposase [Chloroflexota bacterium]|nr:IS21 family transposase [Chloroflexota bacterium]
MAYREMSRMEINEVVRRWQAGESRRAIAAAVGLSRTTVDKYVAEARRLGVAAGGPAPTEDEQVALVRFGGAPAVRGQPARGALAAHRDRVGRWLADERLQLTRVQELLAQEGVAVAYTTLRRFVAQHGLGRAARTTVRVADSAPGEVAEMDFERLGVLVDASTGKKTVVWALLVVLVHSRHQFLWPLVRQTLGEVLAGLEAAWRFFGGVPKRLVLDNFPAAVADADPLCPRPTRGFLEYSQARGFLVDPARRNHPRDKPHVERGVPYARERFWKGGSFTDLADAREQARSWCLAVAGQRVHGTTRRVPLVVFEDEERGALTPLAATPYGDAPYDVPIWRDLVVHADHHVQFVQALYSAPSTTCPPGTKLEARGDRDLVKLYRRGELVKVHPRTHRGGRQTDPDDYPAEKTAYALRAPDRLVRQAAALGEHTGAFAAKLLGGPLPWAALRQGYKLLRLAERYTPARLDAACARALGFEMVDVRRLERILVLALEHEGLPAPPVGERVRSLPPGRFARPASAFDHRHDAGATEAER